MNSETKNCQNCKQSFTIESDDFAFYEKMKVPAPTWCPECRMIRRFHYRNEHSLYKRKCDLCGQDRIMMYAPDSPFKAYCRECWLSDKWDPKSYARDYDPNRSFLEQFLELFRVVPRVGIIKQGNSVDSEYTNRVTDQKGCYLVFGSVSSEFSRYSTWINNSKECLDCYNTQKSEKCYECVDCVKCYELLFSRECGDCSDSSFLFNCRNCTNCFGCVNLRNKSYCIFNQQYTKEEYQKKLAQFSLGSELFREGLRSKLQELAKQFVVPAIVTRHSTNVSGNWIENCKNVRDSFNCTETEDARYSYSLLNGKDIMDLCYWGKDCERIYECINVGIQSSNMKFCNECWVGDSEIEYSMNCHNSKNLFGCSGLRNAEYCILNKAYAPDEYFKLVTQIKEQMTTKPYVDNTGRSYKYGEFFPVGAAAFAYNETLAHEFFPLNKEEVIKQGYTWKEPEARSYKIDISADQLPDNIKDVTDDIVGKVIGCAHSGKCNEQCSTAFRILNEDLVFYRDANIPLPRFCPNCRHYQRLKQRNPLKLWLRKCQCAGAKSDKEAYINQSQHIHGTDHCPNEFETSYSPDRKEIVYCEACYNTEVV